MKYEKAAAEVVRFENAEIFTVTSAENAEIAAALAHMCYGQFDFGGATFTCGVFVGASGQQVYANGKTYSYNPDSPGGSAWSCTKYENV